VEQESAIFEVLKAAIALAFSLALNLEDGELVLLLIEGARVENIAVD